MFNVIFMLLYSVSKIINKSIWSSKKINSCNGCTSSLTLKCIINKYPIVYFFNLSTIATMFITIIAFIIDKYNILTLILSKFNISSNESVGVLGLIILCTISVTFICLYSKGKIKLFADCNCQMDDGNGNDNNININNSFPL